jgi:hypothetical protein
MKTLLVAGSRSFKSWPQERMNGLLDQASYCLDMVFDQVMEGEAPGVDRMARIWAEGKGYPVRPMPAKWERGDGSVNLRAGFERNREMVNLLVPGRDAAIVIWNGHSGGTRDTIERLDSRRVDHVIVVKR